METRRRPIRSMTGPPTRAERRTGRAAQKATNPALPGLPVVSRANQGTAMRVSELPLMEMALAARTVASGGAVAHGVSPRGGRLRQAAVA